jgi:hypothetical protein
LWTYEDDNFTCIYDNYDGDIRVYTVNQMLKYVDRLILKEKEDDKA